MVRPKDIAPPFSKKEPVVLIHDRMWYMAPTANGDAFAFPGWNSDELFSKPGEIRIEYCSGNGTWIAEKAAAHPEINWLAVEKRFDRARKIWSKIHNKNLDNLVVAFAEGLSLTHRYIPASSVSAIYINFPDPWPKARHAKHRIASLRLFEEASRVLVPDGRLIFVTDDEPYSLQFRELASQQTAFSQTIPSPGYSAPPEGYGTSFFDSLFRNQGKKIFYHELSRNTVDEKAHS